MLGEEEAVHAHGVYVHLFDGFAFQDVLVDLHQLRVPVVLHRLQGTLPQQVAAFGQHPYVPVLLLGEFELYRVLSENSYDSLK